jgi:hypothetical protein
MWKLKQIGSMTWASVAVFLFSYSFSISFATPVVYAQALCETISKSENLPVSPDTQFPFEEKEEEGGDEFQDSFSWVCVSAEILSFVSTQAILYSIHQTSSLDHIGEHVPIYLAKRAIII